MEYKIDINSPLNSLKEVAAQLSTNGLSKFVVNCDRSFFQTLIDTKEFDIAYKHYVSKQDPASWRFRTFEVDNFYFIEDFLVQNEYVAVIREYGRLNGHGINLTIQNINISTINN